MEVSFLIQKKSKNGKIFHVTEYLKWREAFYKKNGPINLLITETNNGFVLSKPQMNENLVQQYLYEKYGENAIYEDRLFYELFRQ